MRIVKEHYELKYRALMIGQIYQRSVGDLSRDVSGVDAMLAAGVIYLRAKELRVRSAAVVHFTQQVKRPPRCDDLLRCWAEVRLEGIHPRFVLAACKVLVVRTFEAESMRSKMFAGYAGIFEGDRRLGR